MTQVLCKTLTVLPVGTEYRGHFCTVAWAHCCTVGGELVDTPAWGLGGEHSGIAAEERSGTVDGVRCGTLV